MKKAEDLAGKVHEMQAHQRRSIAAGTEKMNKARERIRKRSNALRKPRDRNLDNKRMMAALREMSKDLDRLERDVASMRKRDEDVSDLLDNRRDLLLRDCFELKKLADEHRLFRDIDRVRSLAEPLGGQRLRSILPEWVSNKSNYS